MPRLGLCPETDKQVGAWSTFAVQVIDGGQSFGGCVASLAPRVNAA